jgi:hypothetical protein
VHSSVCDNSARFMHLAMLLLAGILLVPLTACEEDQRAVPPGAVRDVSTPVANDSEGASNEDAAFTGLVAGEFSAQILPQAERAYFAIGGDLWQLPQTGQPQSVAENLTIASYSASATGDELALLSIDREDDTAEEQTRLTLLDPDGESLFELEDLEPDVDLEQMSPIESIALSPSGDELAMTHRNGAMTLATVDRGVRQLLPPSLDARPGRISWSADGAFITFLDPWMPDEPSALYVIVPEEDSVQRLVAPTPDGRGVVRAKWIPGTPYIVMIKSSDSTIRHGGDLFLIDAETGRQELLMSSGEIAPVAGVVDVAPSPDGTWLAATGFVPGDEYPGFAGLWVINLQSGLRMEIELEDRASVTDLWWLGEDLLIRTIDEPRTSLPGTYTGREDFRLLEIDPDTGRSTQRYAEEEEIDSENDDDDDE